MMRKQSAEQAIEKTVRTYTYIPMATLDAVVVSCAYFSRRCTKFGKRHGPCWMMYERRVDHTRKTQTSDHH